MPDHLSRLAIFGHGIRLALHGEIPIPQPPAIVSYQSEKSLRLAVRECLARCEDGSTPLGVIATFLGELRDNGWLSADIRKVESTALKVLAGIVEPVEASKTAL